MDNPPVDPTATGDCAGYRYYRYPGGDWGCDASKGAYYVLGISDLEAISGTHPESPGFQCAGRNWQAEFEWVTGEYEQNQSWVIP